MTNAVESDLRLHGLPQDRDISSPILGRVSNHCDRIMEGLNRTATLRTGMFKDQATFQLFYDLVLKRSGPHGDLEFDEEPKASNNDWPPTSPGLG